MIRIYKGEDDQFYFKVIAKNGQIVAISEGYTTKHNCLNGIESLRENIGGTDDTTKEKMED